MYSGAEFLYYGDTHANRNLGHGEGYEGLQSMDERAPFKKIEKLAVKNGLVKIDSNSQSLTFALDSEGHLYIWGYCAFGDGLEESQKGYASP